VCDRATVAQQLSSRKNKVQPPRKVGHEPPRMAMLEAIDTVRVVLDLCECSTKKDREVVEVICNPQSAIAHAAFALLKVPFGVFHFSS